MKYLTSRVLFLLLSLGVIFLFYLRIAAFFPNANGYIGHDYSLFFPSLLDGKLWFDANGFFKIPWFTPSFGGGLPKFPNPQSMYYSIPQLLCFYLNPMSAVMITIVLFGAIGFYSFYVLLRRIFYMNRYVAFLGSVLFLFNGFYTVRMIVGHLTYHSFMLLPLFAYYTIRKTHTVKSYIVEIAMGALVISYMIYSGNIHLIIVLLISTIALYVLSRIVCKEFVRIVNFFAKLLLILAFTILISAAPLMASLSYLSLFPRDFYPLPGYNNILALVFIAVISLLMRAPVAFVKYFSVNKLFNADFGPHEYEYGITIVPFVIILFAIVLLFRYRRGDLIVVLRKNVLNIALLILLLFIPIAVNYYTPWWNSVLKSIPIIKNSSTLVRWFSIYIPILIVLCCLSTKYLRLFETHKRSITTIICLIVIVFSLFMINNTQYSDEYYNPRAITWRYKSLSSSDIDPQITNVKFSSLYKGLTLLENDLIVEGTTSLRPYESIFGYDLEMFPKKTLREGNVTDINAQGDYNIKNPVSYVFPKENNLEPGDHFTFDERDKVEKFVNYKPYSFQMPLKQKLANYLSGVSIICLIAGLSYILLNKMWLFVKRNNSNISRS